MPRDPVIEAYRQRIARLMNPSPDRCVDTEIAKFREVLREHMEARRAAIESGAAQAEFRTLRKRVIADLVALAPACREARCRRAGHCKGAETPCIEDHRALVLQRLARLLGYRKADPRAGKDGDILWPET